MLQGSQQGWPVAGPEMGEELGSLGVAFVAFPCAPSGGGSGYREPGEGVGGELGFRRWSRLARKRPDGQ